MPSKKDRLDQLSRDLTAALEGLSMIEKALVCAEALRDECGGEWVIDSKEDGSFVIRRPEDK